MAFFDYKHTLIVMDGNRVVAKAKKTAQKVGWLLQIYDGCWIDERAREPNNFGHIQPQYMLVKTKREAAKIFKSLN